MARVKKAKSEVAVELIYQNIDNLPHPEHGALRIVYFGHKSEGQRKITRATAEAIVMMLEANGMLVLNGLDEVAETLRLNGWTVEAPAEDPQEVPDHPAEGVA